MENEVLEETVLESEAETDADEEFVTIAKVEIEATSTLAKNTVNVC
jgi:hypothetical protein